MLSFIEFLDEANHPADKSLKKYVVGKAGFEGGSQGGTSHGVVTVHAYNPRHANRVAKEKTQYAMNDHSIAWKTIDVTGKSDAEHHAAKEEAKKHVASKLTAWRKNTFTGRHANHVTHPHEIKDHD
jgi:hypothetical protein